MYVSLTDSSPSLEDLFLLCASHPGGGLPLFNPQTSSSPLNICLCLHRCSCCNLWRVNVVHDFTSHSSSLHLWLRMSFCLKTLLVCGLTFSDCHSRAQHLINIGIMGLHLENTVGFCRFAVAELQLQSLVLSSLS